MAGALYLTCCADVGTSSSKSRLKGWTNLAISGEGKREALAIGMAIQGAPLTTLFSSDLDRAITAAQLIASEAETSDIQPSSAWRGTDESEKFEAFESRVFAALQLAMARVQAEDTCLICAHDAVIQLVLAWIESGQDKLSVDPKTFSKTKITGNLITLALNGKTWMVAQTQGVGSSAKRPIPPCADSEIKRIALGQYLQQLIQAGLAAQGNAVQWWEKCLENHRNEFSDDSKPGEGMSSLHIPFAQPRQDMLTAQVCSAVAKQDPYMLASDAAGRGDVEEKKEKVLHRFWQRAGFEKAIRKASSLTTDTNLAWIRVAWDRTSKKPFSGLILDVIEPWNLVIYPPRQTGIVGSRLAGHRFYSSFKSVTILQSGHNF